jgi:hypothetical protein
MAEDDVQLVESISVLMEHHQLQMFRVCICIILLVLVLLLLPQILLPLLLFQNLLLLLSILLRFRCNNKQLYKHKL